MLFLGWVARLQTFKRVIRRLQRVIKVAQGHFTIFFPTAHLFQRINLPLTTKFHVSSTICNKLIKFTLLEVWSQVPQSKNSTGGILQFRSTSNLFQRIKLPPETNFHVHNTICNEFIEIAL